MIIAFYVVAGLLALIEGIFLSILGGLTLGLRMEDIPPSILKRTPIPPEILEKLVGVAGYIFIALGLILLIASGLVLLVSWGLWRGKDWGRILVIVLQALWALIMAVSLRASPLVNIAGLTISLLIIYYMTRPHVKAYFGRVSQQ